MQIIAQEHISIEKITKSMLYHHGEPFATSTQIAKYFGIKHKNVLQKIKSFHSFNELVSRLKIQPRKRTIRGKEYPYFELDADAFAFSCLSITGKKAEAFKWVFIEAFKKSTLDATTAKVSISANKANNKWIAAREHGKDTRKLLTDKIREFCIYAENQRGTTYGGFCPYYKIVTDAIDSFVGVDSAKSGKTPRDVYSGERVEAIEIAELKVIELLEEVMDSGGSRKGIKPLIIDRLTHEMGNLV